MGKGGTGVDEPGKTPSDRELVQGCLEGDERLSRAFFRRFLPQVRQILYRVVGPDPEHEDLVQQALLEVFRSLRRFRGEAALKTWVDRVCVNVARQHLRKRYRRREPVPLGDAMELLPDPGSGPMVLVERQTLVRRLYDLLDRVEEKQRIALVLHEVNGKSVVEVADATGANVSTAKSRIWFGRKKLLKLARLDAAMKDYMAGQEDKEDKKDAKKKDR